MNSAAVPVYPTNLFDPEALVMKWLLRINHVLIVLFAVSSGIVKLVPGNPDLAVFAHLGLGAAAAGAFGLLQAMSGAGLLSRRSVVPAAVLVAACNVFATVGLFAAGIQPFGVISIVFVAMALLELRRARSAASGQPRGVAPRHAPLPGRHAM